jgi:hypothetical protein
LRGVADGIGFIQGRSRNDGAGTLEEKVQRSADGVSPVAEVGAKRDVSSTDG